MTDNERVIAATRARIGAILGLRATVSILSVWLVVWGIGVLVLRGALLVSWPALLWGLAGVVAAAVAGAIIGVRRSPPLDVVRAMLDAHWKCGGLLMTASDVDTSQWPIQAPSRGAPQVSWQAGRHVGTLFCCAVFLIASFFVPANFLSEAASQRLLVGTEVKKLAEKVELLKEEKILPPERAKSIEEALEQLQRDASGNDPAKTWEAIDHLEESVAKASAEAAEEAAREAERAARAQELAAALDQSQSQLTPEALSEAMNSLAQDLQKAADENSELLDGLSDELQSLLENGSLTPEQLADLAEALGNCKAGELGKLQKLVNARLIDASLLEDLEGRCKCDPDALAELLCQCKNGDELAACLACNKPGRGGVSRGRGDAAMTWTDEHSGDDAKFKAKVLPPGAVASLKDSRTQGISVGDPTAAQESEVSSGGALDVANAGRGSARTQVILPEHRKVIQRYFEREPAAKAPTHP